jgi:DNA-binding LacI/PurR family transcriptional regulator
MQKKPYTIVDLARMLEMSKSTVSRALRDQYDVNPETRQKVLDLARKLDFETNTLAASLREKRSYIIGVVIPSFSIPFYSIALGGIQEVASANGYNVMVCQSDEKYEIELANINFLLKSRVDGLLVSLSKDTKDFRHLAKLKNRGIPVVMFNRVMDEADLPMVLIDDYNSALDATRYLIESGCRKIAHISGPESLLMSNKRKQGFMDALLQSGLQVNDEWIIESDFSLESGELAMEKILNQPTLPDAVFCVCDAVAFGAMKKIRERGLSIPKDISVMGFTDEPVTSLVSPPLTTVSQPISEIGQQATQLLLEYIQDIKSPHNRKKEVLPTRIVVRGSTRIL